MSHIAQLSKYPVGFFIGSPVCYNPHFHQGQSQVLEYLNFKLLKIFVN